MYSILFLATAAFFACMLLTPLVRAWSQKHDLFDRPDARKHHIAPTPRTGGIAIGLAYLGALGLLVISPLNGAESVNIPFALGLVPAAISVFMIGLLDDLVGLRPWEKLLGQVLASVLAYMGGVQVAGVAGFAANGWWTLPTTVFWLVGCSNAFNLIDGMDGLATGVGLFASFTTLAAALMNHNTPLALATAPLVGALLAFLRYNFNPASIFLGDCGSLTIGFILGCFAAVWSQKSATFLGMTAPLMALAVPLLDTGVSVVRRFLRGQPIFSPDRNHVHHRLLDRGFSPRQVALLIYGVCGIAAAFSLLVTWPETRFNGLLLIGFCAAVWVGVQAVGYVEFDVVKRLTTTGIFRNIVNARASAKDIERRLASAATPDDYWDIVRAVGQELGSTSVRLFVGGKVFEDRDRTRDTSLCCTIRVPLGDEAYVNFKYPVDLWMQHAVIISSTVEVLQRSIQPRTLESQALKKAAGSEGQTPTVRIIRSR